MHSFLPNESVSSHSITYFYSLAKPGGELYYFRLYKTCHLALIAIVMRDERKKERYTLQFLVFPYLVRFFARNLSYSIKKNAEHSASACSSPLVLQL